jgi:hypothetical protein
MKKNVVVDLMKIRSFEERNAAFRKLSRKERRTAIARDVVAQLDAGRYLAKARAYFKVRHGVAEKFDGDVQRIGAARDVSCSVCALGAGAVSRARLGDQVAVDEGESLDAYEALRCAFSDVELYRMECAFELWTMYDDAGRNDEPSSFGARFQSPRQRLRAIWQNVIDNGGKFCP